MAERGRGEKPAKTESTVTGADWYGEDVSGQEHTRVLFVDLDMTDAHGSGAVFTECTFRRARFNVAALESTAFLNCTFSGCSFYNARLKDCKLVGGTFDGCTFDVLEVTGGNWSFVGLRGAVITIDQAIIVAQALGLDVRLE